MREALPPESPKHCPCGHKHISWSPDEQYVYCWDCNRKYPLTECFGPRIVQSAAATKGKEQK
ncbi:MAG TPA: hypothetical protein VMU60_13490 [Syntrophobacteria bacterium]|nr:hypothetical protein [Syntrophobacteria bacterium]